MNAMKSMGWVVGLSVIAGALMATSARAESSYSDITGTNIWNNTAPIFDTDTKLDPTLIENVTRVNRESEAAFRACNAAVDRAEQTVPTNRRFARQPSAQTAEVPAACRQLEQLRAEAESLRRTLQDAERATSNSAFLTW
jgi:hypothetical protein